MALPPSGQLSIGDINVELGRASNAPNSTLRNLANLAVNPSRPYDNRNGENKISHWYNYPPSAITPYIGTNKSCVHSGSVFLSVRNNAISNSVHSAFTVGSYFVSPTYTIIRTGFYFNVASITNATRAYVKFDYTVTNSSTYPVFFDIVDGAFFENRSITTNDYNDLLLNSSTYRTMFSPNGVGETNKVINIENDTSGEPTFINLINSSSKIFLRIGTRDDATGTAPVANTGTVSITNMKLYCY